MGTGVGGDGQRVPSCSHTAGEAFQGSAVDRVISYTRKLSEG